MSYEPVDLYVRDTSPARNPIAGVAVRVYSENGKIFYTQTVTDTAGHAGFLLPSDMSFQLRFWKPLVGFQNPQYIAVVPAPGTNVFDIPAEVQVPPMSRSARLCVAYGHFYRIDGSPAASVDIHVIPRFNPLVVDGGGFLAEPLGTRTDKNGYVEMSLLRCGIYDVTVQGQEDYQRQISVPDAVNVNWPDLLFPVVERVSFDPVLPTALAVDQEVYSTPSIYASDGNFLPQGSTNDVIWRTSDDTVLAVYLSGGVLTLRGVGPGVARVLCVRADQTIVRIPDVPIKGLPDPIVVA